MPVSCSLANPSIGFTTQMLMVESCTIDGVNRAKLILEANGRSKIIEGLQQHANGK